MENFFLVSGWESSSGNCGVSEYKISSYKWSCGARVGYESLRMVRITLLLYLILHTASCRVSVESGVLSSYV